MATDDDDDNDDDHENEDKDEDENGDVRCFLKTDTTNILLL